MKIDRLKKLFDRLNKIVFVVGIVALIILVLITAFAIIGGEYMVADHSKETKED